VTKQTTRVLKDLRAKRMESGQRSQKRVSAINWCESGADMQAERALRSGRAGSADSAGNSTEDGEVAPYDPYSRPSRSPPPKKRYHDDKEDKEDLDSIKPSYQDVNGARLSRYEIVDIMYKDGFEDVLKGELRVTG
jgi:RNA polymerase-associated protein RTF1